MKKCLGETEGSLIRIKKPKISKQQIATHWNMILARIEPAAEEIRQSAHLLKK
ncbi:hypothetical protein ACFGVR_01340 [Mucilaginibacter sp. AW1-3]